MNVSYRTGITIFQFFFFVPSLLLAVYLWIHHGMKQAVIFRFIATLSALRVAGDISWFISLSQPTIGVYVAVIVCELLGLAPLIHVNVALVGRVNQISHSFPPKSTTLVSLLSLTGLVIGIVGTNRALQDAPTPNDVHINGLMEGALALFLVAYGFMLFGYLYIMFDVKRHPAKRIALGTETRILSIVGLASPFLFVRLLYAALGEYTGNPDFSTLDGNTTIYLIMDVLMEIITITICLSVAFLVPMPKEEKKKTTGQQRDDNAEDSFSSATRLAAHDKQEIGLVTRT